MPLRGLVGAACAVALAACATTPRSPVPGPQSPPSWQRDIAPFSVTDAGGRPYDLPFLGGINAPRPQLVDLDGDGRPELYLQEVTGTLMQFVPAGARDGRPVWRVGSLRYGGLNVGEWYRFADLDGDGDHDLLAEEPFSYVRYWRNDGTRTAPRFVLGADTLKDADGTPIFADRQNIPQLGDIDCNGLADLLIGKLDGTVARYELVDGTARAVPRFRLLSERFENIQIIGEAGPQLPPRQGGGGPTAHGANTMALADHDDDGDPDLFWGDFFEPGLLLIENTGSCTQPNFRNKEVRFPQDAPILTSGYNAPTFGDVDGDGRPDLVMGVLGGAFNQNRTTVHNLHYLRHAAPGTWVPMTERLVPMVDVGSESVPALVDLDGDGDLDLLLANKIDPDSLATSRVYRFENVGSRQAPAFRLRGALPLSGRYHYAPAFGDLDGDGRTDMLLGQWGAAVAWYRGGAAGFVLVDSAAITITRGSNTTPTLGDLDGDGDLDLVIGEASGALNYYENRGTRTTPRFVLVSDTWLDLDVGRRSAPHLVDLDGDGDLDLLIGTELDGIWLLRNEGSRTSPRFVREETFRLEVPALAVPATGDVTGDGVPELFVGTVGGGALYFTLRSPTSR